jgi:exonuclease III
MTFPNILQWNCRGLRANFKELKFLIDEYHSYIVCLQETRLPENNNINLRGYSIYHKILNNNPTFAGGVSNLIHNSIPSSPLSLTTSLQAVATRITLHRPLTICNLYLPPV